MCKLNMFHVNIPDHWLVVVKRSIMFEITYMNINDCTKTIIKII